MIKHILLIAFGSVVFLPIASPADDVPLGQGTTVHFASASEGRKLLATKDDFIERLSPFDRSARMKVDRPVSTEEFLTWVEQHAVDWTHDEMQSVEKTVRTIQPQLQKLALSFPPAIQMIKTTGAEEGGAAYTRGSTVILPRAELAKDQKHLERLLCHELFHILSRQNPGLRDRLYQVIGFSKCEELKLPAELSSRKITNPDAPKNDHFIRLKIEGRECLAVPILLSTSATYDVKRGGEFFEYLQFTFLIVKKNPSNGRLTPEDEGGKPRLVPPQAVSDFFEQVGRNTEYIIHPEEILADNFALLVMGEQNIQSPEIIRKMREALAGRKKADG